MFILHTIEEKVKVAPEQFDRPITEVIIEQIEIKFSNRIIPNVGLCICFYDFLSGGDSYIYPAEGGSIQDMKFRLVVFQPFVGGKF